MQKHVRALDRLEFPIGDGLDSRVIMAWSLLKGEIAKWQKNRHFQKNRLL